MNILKYRMQFLKYFFVNHRADNFYLLSDRFHLYACEISCARYIWTIPLKEATTDIEPRGAIHIICNQAIGYVKETLRRHSRAIGAVTLRHIQMPASPVRKFFRTLSLGPASSLFAGGLIAPLPRPFARGNPS